MADQLLTGTTLVEKESRSAGDIPIGGVTEWDDTFANIPDNFRLCDGSTITDPTSSYDGSAVPNYNTQYYTISGAGIQTRQPDENDVVHSEINTDLTLTGGSLYLVVPVELPHGATITGAVMYSSVSTETWSLKSAVTSDTSDVVTHATAALNTEDTTITTGTVDNSTRKYFFVAQAMDAGDVMRGALITYTPRLKFIIRIK